MKKLFVLFISCILSCIPCKMFADEIPYIQYLPEYMPQAPTAQAIARAIDIPVNPYTGIPNIDIPIYTIQVGDISVPISLSYQGGGIRPSQEATCVGLGWMLNAGGAITRTVKCADDFMEYHVSNSQFRDGFLDIEEWLNPVDPEVIDENYYTTYRYTNGYGFEQWGYYLHTDSEADVFFYNFQGNSGKFSYKKDKSIVYFDKSANVDIWQVPGLQPRPYFYAKDAQGNSFCFETKERTHVYSANSRKYVNTTAGGTDVIYPAATDYFEEVMDYTSTWYLTSIISATNDTVCFDYEDESFHLPIQENARYQRKIEGIYDWGDADGRKGSVSETHVEGKRLVQIKWRGGIVKFKYGNARIDLIRPTDLPNDPKPLTDIMVYNVNDVLVGHWKMSYDYFNNDITGVATNMMHLFKRLQLKQIRNVLTEENPYKFTYYETVPLPVKNTKNLDYWGFYNGVDQGEDYFCPASQDIIISHKSANEYYGKIGVLESIEHPTEGVTRFHWEANYINESVEFYDPQSAENYHSYTQGFLQTCKSGSPDFPKESTKMVLLSRETEIFLLMSSVYIGAGNSSESVDIPFSVNRINTDATATQCHSWNVKNIGSEFDATITLAPGVYQFKCLAPTDSVIYSMFFIDSKDKGEIKKENYATLVAYKGNELPEIPIETKMLYLENECMVILNYGGYFLYDGDTVELSDICPFSIHKRQTDGSFQVVTNWALTAYDLNETKILHLDAGVYQIECEAVFGDIFYSLSYSYGDIEYNPSELPDYSDRWKGRSLGVYKENSVKNSGNWQTEETDTFILQNPQRIFIDMCYLEYTTHTSNTNTVPLIIYKKNTEGDFAPLFRIPMYCFYNIGIWGNDVVKLYLDAGTYIIKCEATVEDVLFYVGYAYETGNIYINNGAKRGGLRIARIEGEKDVSYFYEGGKDLITPCTYYKELLKGDKCIVTCMIQASETVRPLSTMKNGNIIGYSKVWEVFSDDSKIEYVYYNEKEELQDPDFPYSPSQTDWSNGLLLKKIVYDTLGDTVSSISNVYETTVTTESYKMGFKEIFPGNVFYYYNTVKCPQLYHSTYREYRDGGVFVTKKKFTYNENLLCEEEIIQTGTDIHRNVYRYASDYSDEISQKMVAVNMVGTPVAQWSFRNGVIYKGIRSIYGNFGKLSTDGNTITCGELTGNCENFSETYLPKYLLTLNTEDGKSDISDCIYDTTIVYNSYTRFGKARDLNYKGLPISYVWAYQGMYPVAEIKNATYQQFVNSYGNSSLDIDMTMSIYQDEEYFRDRIWSTCGLLNNVSVKIYTYNPLIGIKDAMNERGLISSYSYDTAGRLSSAYLSSLSYFPTSEKQQSFSYGKNYVSTKNYSTWQSQSSIENIQYYDEWGRPSVTASQGAKQDGSFSYAMQTYDLMGRPQRSYMSVPSNSTTGEMIDVSTFQNLSLSAFSNDPFGYSQTLYDALGRTIETTLPGKAWNENKKSTTIQYLTNTANEVKKYTVSGNTLNESGYYETGMLECTMTTDPDGLTIKSYKDLFGNVVLERRAGNFDTYYVYDNYNRLRFVLPPKYQEENNLGYYAYQYEYDGRGRVVKKTLPGCEPIQYWYDKADRLIKMQDGVLAQSGYYRVWTYDALGRQLTQGIERNGALQHYELLNYYDNYNFTQTYSAYLPIAVDNIFPSGYNQGKKGHLTGTWQRTTDGQGILMVMGYDDFGYLSKKTVSALDKFVTVFDYTNNLASDVTEERFREYTYKSSNGSMEKVISGVVNHNYDYQHTRLLASSVLSLLDNSGNVLRTDTISHLTYDEFGRIKRNNRGGAKADMTYEYDPMHGWVNRINSAGGFEQRLYRETEGNTPRWNGGISAMTWKVNNAYLRRFDYDYDAMNRLTSAEYSQYEITGGSSLSPTLSLLPVGMENEDYTSEYGYDKNSNLLWAYRQGVVDDVEEGLYYDTMDDYNASYRGNQKLSVGGTGVGEPSYYGSSSFVDGANEAVEYAYNANGSMTMDLNKGITNIAYDLLGNLKEITFNNNRSIRYVYAADGTRLRTVHLQKKNGVWLKDSTDYYGNLLLKNGALNKYLFSGGYLSFDNGIANGCHYYVKDYQGSNRMVVNSGGATEQIIHYYPYGGVIGGIDLGSNLQSYKFEGKELDRTYGLDWYDIHARQYDPIVPAWHTIDPQAEKSYGISPYAYCAGDPVNKVDRNGEIPFATNIVGALLAAGVDYAGQVAKNYIEGKGLLTCFTYKIDISDIIVSAAEGFVTSGASLVGKGAKAAISVGTEFLSNAVDANISSEDIDISINSVRETAINTAIGLVAGEINIGPKYKPLQQQSVNKTVKAVRQSYHNRGEGLPTSKAKQIQGQVRFNNKVVKELNRAISDESQSSVSSIVDELLKWDEENDENEESEKFKRIYD